MALPAVSPPALATETTIVFQDNFGTSDLSNVENRDVPGYDDWDDDSDDGGTNCAIRDWGTYTGGHSLRLREGAFLRKNTISTTGLTNIHLEYTWGEDTDGDGSEDGSLIVEWKQSSSGTWSNVNTHVLTGTDRDPGYNLVDATLPAGAAGTSIDIRFTGSTPEHDDKAWVDNVIVSGDPGCLNNGQFGVKLVSVTNNLSDNTQTWCYNVTNLASGTSCTEMSYWVLDLCDTPAQNVTSSSPSASNFTDPGFGHAIKWEAAVAPGATQSFCFTLDGIWQGVQRDWETRAGDLYDSGTVIGPGC